MKKYLIPTALLLVTALSSCTKTINEDLSGNEHSLLELRVEGQMGTAIIDQPDTPPSYEEEKQEEPAPAENQTPKTGDTKDGMVYVEGFGWITDEGEGSGIYADDMYENGNKIGIMD